MCSFPILDYNMKCSLAPSVYLKTDLPEIPDNFFVGEKVTTVVSDSVFEQPVPFRHAVEGACAEKR